jgi:hypothetical protein
MLRTPVVTRNPRNDAGNKSARRKNFFIIFIDAMFTTLFERPFTKVLEVIAQIAANTCVYRACHAD